jgi:hypothetical protein
MQESVRAQFRNSSSYAMATMAGLAVGAIFDAGLLYFALRHLHDGLSASSLVLKLHLLVRLTTACAFLTWFDRMYANVDALQGSSDFPRWWAIGGFFIPPFALFRPCEIATEIWRRTTTRDDAPIIVYVWWAAFLNAAILVILGRTATSYGMYVAAAGTAIVMVRILTVREEAAYLVKQGEDRRAIQEAKVAAALRPAPVAPQGAASGPATPGGIAPSLAAIEAAAAERAAARRASATWAQPRPQVPQTSVEPQPIPPLTDRPALEAGFVARPAMPAVTPIPPGRPVTIPRTTVKAPRRHVSHEVIWILFLAIFLGAGGVAMLARAADVAFDGTGMSRILGGIYAVEGAVLVGFGFLLGRQRAGDPATGEWRMVAIAGALVVMANIVVIAGLAG